MSFFLGGGVRVLNCRKRRRKGRVPLKWKVVAKTGGYLNKYTWFTHTQTTHIYVCVCAFKT